MTDDYDPYSVGMKHYKCIKCHKTEKYVTSPAIFDKCIAGQKCYTVMYWNEKDGYVEDPPEFQI